MYKSPRLKSDPRRWWPALLLTSMLVGVNALADERVSFQLDGVSSAAVIKTQTTPFNQSFSLAEFAGISAHTYDLELRPNLELELNPCTVNLKPRARTAYINDPEAERADTDIFFNTALFACRLLDSVELKIGRQRLTWGNSQFRSPSNPFYSEAVLFNPVNELVGKDFAILEYSKNFSWKTSVIANWDESHIDQPANPHYQFIKTYGVKTEYTGQSSQWGALVSRREAQPTRVSGFMNYTLNRAVLTYGELSISKDTAGLLPVPQSNNTLTEFQPAAQVRHSYNYSILVGASYTLLNGWTANAEYLHTNEGFNKHQAVAWQNAGHLAIEVIKTGAGTEFAAPVLADAIDPLWRQLRRNYLIFGLNRSEYQNRFDIALQNIHNLDDTSNSLAASVVYQSSDNTELFFVGNVNTGGGSREFARLIEHALVVGLRFYTF